MTSVFRVAVFTALAPAPARMHRLAAEDCPMVSKQNINHADRSVTSAVNVSSVAMTDELVAVDHKDDPLAGSMSYEKEVQ